MATVLVRDVVERAETILQDTTNTRWTKDELLNWLNDGQLAIVNRRPDLHVTNAAFSCVAGTKQSLPADGLRLAKVLRNTGGKAIREIDMRILDDQIPDWHNPVAANSVDHYSYDLRDPKSFYVYPAAAVNHSIDIIYTVAPSPITIANWATDNTTITLDDSYLNPILDWILYRSYSKDADYAANVQRAQMHLDAFKTALGEKTSSDMAVAEISQ